jgi:hypothetical protein
LIGLRNHSDTFANALGGDNGQFTTVTFEERADKTLIVMYEAWWRSNTINDADVSIGAIAKSG